MPAQSHRFTDFVHLFRLTIIPTASLSHQRIPLFSEPRVTSAMNKWFADKLITFSRETSHLRYFSGNYNSQICALDIHRGHTVFESPLPLLNSVTL